MGCGAVIRLAHSGTMLSRSRRRCGAGVRCFYDADKQIELVEELSAIYGEQAAAVLAVIMPGVTARVRYWKAR